MTALQAQALDALPSSLTVQDVLVVTKKYALLDDTDAKVLSQHGTIPEKTFLSRTIADVIASYDEESFRLQEKLKSKISSWGERFDTQTPFHELTRETRKESDAYHAVQELVVSDMTVLSREHLDMLGEQVFTDTS